MSSLVKRLALTGTATVGALALMTGTAMAHHCYVPTKSLKGPVSSNWAFMTVPDVAEEFGLVDDPCQEQVDAGVDALRAAGLPVSIKFFEKQMLGDSMPEHLLRDGKGLEQMGAGSTAADEALELYAAVVEATACTVG